MVKVGQTVTRAVPVIAGYDSVRVEKRLMRGKVVFVHPKGRFHTFEVECGAGKLKCTIDGTE